MTGTTTTTTTVTPVTPQLVKGDTWRIRVHFADERGPISLSAQGYIPGALIVQPSIGLVAPITGRNIVVLDDVNGVVDFIVQPVLFTGLLRVKGFAAIPAPFRFQAFIVDQFGDRQTYVAQDFTPVDITTADLSTVTLAPIGIALVVPLVPQAFAAITNGDPNYTGESGGGAPPSVAGTAGNDDGFF